jgi:uncharacterized protein YgiM (DUF1202 family)
MSAKLLTNLLLTVFLLSCSSSNPTPLLHQENAVTRASTTPPLPAPKKVNTATVISQHANLRDADNASATVIQTVPQDSLVEVIKQQGAWYLVKTETAQGWMHGNTLKLQNYEASVSTSTPQPSTASTLESQTTTVDLKIKGNKNSLIYHLPNCASYDKISERNIVWFKTTEEAEKAGFRMARNCS